MVEIDSDFEVVTTVPLARREIYVGESLPARGDGFGVQVVVSTSGLRVHEIGTCAVRSEINVVFVEGESGFDQHAIGEVVLVFDAGEVGVFDILGIRELRTLGREERVLIVEMIHQETRGEDVAIGEIGLELGEISEAKGVIVVLSDGQRGIDGVVVLAVEGVIEPDVAFHDRAGEGEERKELVVTPSVLVLE